MTSTRALLAAVIVSLVGVAGLLQLPTPVQAQSSGEGVAAPPTVSSASREVPALAALATTVPTGSVAPDGSLTVGAERPRLDGSAAKDSGWLSALAVVILVLIVAVTAVAGSRKSSR